MTRALRVGRLHDSARGHERAPRLLKEFEPASVHLPDTIERAEQRRACWFVRPRARSFTYSACRGIVFGRLLGDRTLLAGQHSTPQLMRLCARRSSTLPGFAADSVSLARTGRIDCAAGALPLLTIVGNVLKVLAGIRFPVPERSSVSNAGRYGKSPLSALRLTYG